LKQTGRLQEYVKQPSPGQKQPEYYPGYKPYADVLCHVIEHGLDDEIVVNTRGTDAGASEAFFAGEEVIPQ